MVYSLAQESPINTNCVSHELVSCLKISKCHVSHDIKKDMQPDDVLPVVDRAPERQYTMILSLGCGFGNPYWCLNRFSSISIIAEPKSGSGMLTAVSIRGICDTVSSGFLTSINV